MTRNLPASLLALLCCTALPPATAADDAAELAKKLANPIADLVSVPMQFNRDYDIGSAKGTHSYTNVQPVIPIQLNSEWNVISRTILPVQHQHDIAGPSGTQVGIGDTTQSLFFSPRAPTASGVVWGVGPAFLLPTANDKLLGTGKFGIGPTAVALLQRNGWTVGALGNHISSFAGADHRNNVSSTYLQPFLTYTTHTHTTFSLNTESSYNWKTEQWSVPVNIAAAQLFKVGKQPMQLSIGARYWADSPDTGPQEHRWGIRVQYTLLFPK